MGRQFKVPRHIKTDFNDFLDTAGIEDQVFTCLVFKDWYNPNTAFEARVEMYADASKSRYDNSDNRINVRFKRGENINKGDIVRNELGEYFVLDWRVMPEINNRASRALRCNHLLNIKRLEPEKVNERGIVIEPEHYELVVEDLPVNATEYDGRVTYSSISTAPGPVSDILLNVVCQYNQCTKNICVDDNFTFGTSDYVVVNVNYSGMDVGNTNGTITVQAKKKAGTERHGE